MECGWLVKFTILAVSVVLLTVVIVLMPYQNRSVFRCLTRFGFMLIYIMIFVGQAAGQNLDYRENFDIAVARAVAEMRVLGKYWYLISLIFGLDHLLLSKCFLFC